MAIRKAAVRLTTKFIIDQPLAKDSAHPIFFWDKSLKGFGVKVTKSGKKYIAETKVRGSTVRVTIDACNVISLEVARNRARGLLAEMHNDVNPNVKRRIGDEQAKTFGEICREYIDSKELSYLTRRDYEKHLAKSFHAWTEKPFLEISRDMAVQLYRKLADRDVIRGGVRRKVSPAQANQAFRFARAVFKFARRYRGEDGMPHLRDNPIDVLSENLLLRRVNQRTNIVRTSQLQSVWEAIWALRNSQYTKDRETIRDYLLVLLLTGLRLGEARELRWEDVDLNEGVLTIPDPKNHCPHQLPFSDYLWALLRRRKDASGDSKWVFPSSKNDGATHLVEFRKTISYVCDISSVKFSPHDLRRTFLTYVQYLPTRFNVFFTKRLANHRVNDVTERYVNITLDDLRECMQQITDFILDHSCANNSGVGVLLPPPPPSLPPNRKIRVRKPLEQVQLLVTNKI